MPDDTARSGAATVQALPRATAQLVRIAAAIAGLDEQSVRDAMNAATDVDPTHVEEIILQSYLFAGFPRALNAARVWRSFVRQPSDRSLTEAGGVSEWRARGEKTCSVVYGEAYAKLRQNIRALHPLLDEWMIVDGYGKVLSRPLVDLRTRELCIVAACAAQAQQRQLHSHLHGAMNAGATREEVDATLDTLADLLPADRIAAYKLLLARVRPAGSPDVH